MAKVFPSIYELGLQRTDNVTCEVAGCGKHFKHSLALRFHLVKVHNIIKTESDHKLARKQKTKHIDYQYHCPENGCLYYHDNPYSKYFKTMKLLKQHYKQVHCQRKHTCIACGSKFGRFSDLKRHRIKCIPQLFELCNEMSSNATKPEFPKRKDTQETDTRAHKKSCVTKIRPILPKPVKLYKYPTTSTLITNWGQNDPNVVLLLHQLVTNTPLMLNTTMHEKNVLKSDATQTNEGLMFRTTETQTWDNPRANKKSQGSQVLLSRKNQLTEKENSHTQTHFIDSQNCFPDLTNYQEMSMSKLNEGQTLQNTYDIKAPPHFLFFNDYLSFKNHLSTKIQNNQSISKQNEVNLLNYGRFPNGTNIRTILDVPSLKTVAGGLSSISQQTSYNELLLDFSCTAGTQTCELLHKDETSVDLSFASSLNHMETQTADMLDLFSEEFMSDLKYTDIETQTSNIWDDFLY